MMATGKPGSADAASAAEAEGSAARAGAAWYRNWIAAKALPLWSAAGFDAPLGLFHERLDLTGRPQDTVPRRAMVQCRQIYVFADAARLGWFTDGGRLAEIAMGSLVGRFCDGGDPSGGVAFSVSAAGRVASPVRDAYAHAFFLFALASLYRLNGDHRLLGYADSAIAFIEARLGDPVYGGVYDAAPLGERTKRQNPHMHLLEAYIALEAAAPGRGYLDRARRLVELFRTRLFRADPGVLLEYFAEDWGPHPDPSKRWIFEPGHHFEWVWLLMEYEKFAGERLDPWVETLDRIARGHGLAANGLLFDEVGSDMQPLKHTHRIWPHTEAIKAAVARSRAGDAAAPDFAVAMIGVLGTNFLDKPFCGGWIDQIGADGEPLVDYAPASSLYHLFLAATEMWSAFGASAGEEPAR